MLPSLGGECPGDQEGKSVLSLSGQPVSLLSTKLKLTSMRSEREPEYKQPKVTC